MAKPADTLRDPFVRTAINFSDHAHDVADLLDECEKVLRDVLPLLNMAFAAEGDVFGCMHNSATDTDGQIQVLISKLEGNA